MRPGGRLSCNGESVFRRIKKCAPWRTLAPERGCASSHLPLREVRIGSFFVIDKKAPSCTIRTKPSKHLRLTTYCCILSYEFSVT